MRKIFATILILLFVSGCIETLYDHRVKIIVTDPNTNKVIYYDESLIIKHNKAMVNDRKTDLSASLSDGTSFGVGTVVTTADPNSAKAIGEAVSGVLSTGVLSGLTK